MQISKSEIKKINSIKKKKNGDITQSFLLEGWKPLLDALHSDFHINLIVVEENLISSNQYQNILSLAKSKKVEIKEIKRSDLDKLSDTKNCQGVVAIVQQNHYHLDDDKLKSSKLIVALDKINDPGNLGTIIRTCDWYNVDYVLLNKDCVSLYNNKVIRATAGSIFHVKVIEGVDLEEQITRLNKSGFVTIATSLDGNIVDNKIFRNRCLLLFGNEASGINKDLLELCAKQILLPRYGKAESLNVAIACGIFLDKYKTANINV